MPASASGRQLGAARVEQRNGLRKLPLQRFCGQAERRRTDARRYVERQRSAVGGRQSGGQRRLRPSGVKLGGEYEMAASRRKYGADVTPGQRVGVKQRLVQNVVAQLRNDAARR